MSRDLPASRSASVIPQELNWRTVPIPRDLPLSGWIAGPPFGVHCHNAGEVSKPCWRRLTGGALRCERCVTNRARLIGYVPLILFRDHARRVVIVSKTVLPSVEHLPNWSPVICLTPKLRGLPSSVRATEDPAMKSSTWSKLVKRPAEDIRPYLLRVLWRVPELCEYFGLTVWEEE